MSNLIDEEDQYQILSENHINNSILPSFSFHSNLHSPKDKVISKTNESNINSYKVNKSSYRFNASSNIRPSEGVKESTLAYFILLILGLGNLLPWNVFITAQPYYTIRFCGTPYAQNFEVFFGISYNLAQVLGLLVSLFCSEIISLQTQVRIPLIIYAIIFLLTLVTVVINIAPIPLFWLTLLSSFLCGFFGSIMIGGLFGIAGLLPSKYTSSLMLGASCSALSSSFLSFVIIIPSLTSSCITDDETTNNSTNCSSFYIDIGSVIFFTIALLSLFACSILFEIFLNLPFLNYYYNKLTKNQIDINDPNILVLSMSFKDSKVSDIISKASEIDPNKQSISYREINNEKDNIYLNALHSAYHDPMDSSEIDNNDIQKPLQTSTTNISNTSGNVTTFKEIYSVYKQIAIPCNTVFATQAIYLAYLPAILVLIEPQDLCSLNKSKNIFNKLWIPILFVFINTFDLIGRIIGEYYKDSKYMPFNPKNIWIPLLIECFFSILLLFCNLSNSRLPKIFKNDSLPLLFISLFAIFEGCACNLSMMYPSEMVKLEQSSLANIIMIMSLTVGLLIGSLTSFLLVYIVQGSVLS